MNLLILLITHTTVSFRYIVFRPWMEEILVGKIRSCSPEGVHGIIIVFVAQYVFLLSLLLLFVLLQSHWDSSMILLYCPISYSIHHVLTKWNRHGFGCTRLKMVKNMIFLWIQVYILHICMIN